LDRLNDITDELDYVSHVDADYQWEGHKLLNDPAQRSSKIQQEYSKEGDLIMDDNWMMDNQMYPKKALSSTIWLALMKHEPLTPSTLTGSADSWNGASATPQTNESDLWVSQHTNKALFFSGSSQF